MVRHPAHPFLSEHVDPPPDIQWKDPKDLSEEELKELQRAAFQYVEAVNKTHAFLRPEWLAGLDPSKTLLPPRLKWFPLQPQKNRRTPPGVLWLDRYENAGSANPQVCIDRTALLLAGFFLDEKDEFKQDIPLLGGQGLSVIVHLDKLESGRARVRITGLFNTVPMALDEDVTARVFADLQRLVKWERITDNFAKDALHEFGLDAEAMQIAQAGVRIPQELFVKPSSGAKPPRTYFDYIARTTPLRKPEAPPPPEGAALALRGRIWDWPQNDPDYQFEAILKHPLSAHVFAEVYERDPISNKGPSAHRGLRPNRSWLVWTRNGKRGSFLSSSRSAAR